MYRYPRPNRFIKAGGWRVQPTGLDKLELPSRRANRGMVSRHTCAVAGELKELNSRARDRPGAIMPIPLKKYRCEGGTYFASLIGYSSEGAKNDEHTNFIQKGSSSVVLVCWIVPGPLTRDGTPC
mmetsp:Transcript_24539/g.36016  ORF Transcript_24539/g.36016 Transcript_24539/m.36016 type:complete len:125 (+) Transcript_24539:52-426(+)